MVPITDREYGDWLRWRREVYKQTLEQVAKALECSVELLADLEAGRLPIIGQKWDLAATWLGMKHRGHALQDAKRYVSSQRRSAAGKAGKARRIDGQ
jgi:transcriptional regulator with XRE-family HTH domain